MKDIKQINTEDGYDNIGEYIDYWFDSIHSCRDMENKTENSGDNLNPPVIVVCTGIDKCKNNLENKKKQFCRGLNSLLDKEEKQKHLRHICYVSNTEPSDTDFDQLRQSIFEFGKELKTFGEILPLKWIRLERSLDILREAGVNILSWPDITVLSSKCSIDDENEIILFLKYQHQVGSIIYFENLKENIILNQKWLANAFRCLVSDKFDSNIALTSEWKILEDTGKLEPVLIEKLFQKDPQLEFNKHQRHLLNVMELFGIIVKLTTLSEEGQKQSSSTYYLPCMICKQISIVEINKVFSVEKENCKRTPWLCIEFAFMPLDFFNQILCCYLNQYTICTEPSTTRLAIYHGMGIFDLDNTGLRKFILCFSKNTIAVQLWQWKEVEKANFQTIMEELKAVIHGVKDKYEPRKVSYVIKLKCSDGNIHNPVGRLSYKELVELGDDTEYLCRDNTKCHNTRDFFQTWFADYSETNFLTEEKRIDNDSELHNSIKATISLCSEKNERVARLDSTTNITPISHKEYDKAYYMESLGCDKSGNRDSDPDDYRNKEMRTFREQEYDEMIVLTSPNNLLLENNSAKLKTQKVKNSEKSMNKAKTSNDHALTSPLNNNNKDTNLSLLNELDLAQNDFRFTDFEPWKKEPEFTVVGKKKKKLPTAKEVMSMKESLLPPKPMKREERRKVSRSVTPPPLNKLSSNIEGDRTRDLSPSAFPALISSNKSSFRDARRNSTGDVRTDVQSIIKAQDDSDIESVKSLPASSQGVWGQSSLSPRLPVSYAKMAASPKPSVTSLGSSTTEEESGETSMDLKSTKWKGQIKERRHSIGSHPENMKETESSGIKQKFGSQEVLNHCDQDVLIDSDLGYSNGFRDESRSVKTEESNTSLCSTISFVNDSLSDTNINNQLTTLNSEPARQNNLNFSQEIDKSSELLSNPRKNHEMNNVEKVKSTKQTVNNSKRVKQSVIFMDKRVSQVPPNLGISFFFDSENESSVTGDSEIIQKCSSNNLQNNPNTIPKSSDSKNLRNNNSSDHCSVIDCGKTEQGNDFSSRSHTLAGKNGVVDHMVNLNVQNKNHPHNDDAIIFISEHNQLFDAAPISSDSKLSNNSKQQLKLSHPSVCPSSLVLVLIGDRLEVEPNSSPKDVKCKQQLYYRQESGDATSNQRFNFPEAIVYLYKEWEKALDGNRRDPNEVVMYKS